MAEATALGRFQRVDHCISHTVEDTILEGIAPLGVACFNQFNVEIHFEFHFHGHSFLLDKGTGFVTPRPGTV